MRVLLITPTFHYADSYPNFLSFSDFPTGFGYLASSLKQAGHEVFGCNPNNIIGYPNAYMMIQDVISKKVNEVKPDLIGLGGLCTDYAFLKDAIGIIRRVSRTPIVLGGQIVTNDAEDVFKLLKPDYAIVGEGEEILVSLTDYIQGDNNKGYSDKWLWESHNLCFWTDCGTRAIHTALKRGDKPIDELPFPDYEPFGIQDMIDNYSDFTRMLYRYSRPFPRPYSIVASRSCPFTCTFCIHGHRDIPYRARSIESIMDEIKITYEKYHFNILILLDELFAVDKKRMNEFCNGICNGKEKYGWDFDWMFQTHASAKLDLESLKKAREAGCISFSYGLESASPKVLKSMNKKIRVEQVIEAIHLAKEAKIGFSANLIFGDPAETQETIAESLAFWLEYGRDCCIFLAQMKPYPGSKVFDYCVEEGLIKGKKDYYENIDKYLINMTSIPNDIFKEFMTLLNYLEAQWLFVKTAKAKYFVEPPNGTIIEKLLGGQFVQIRATCSNCGEESMYRMHRTEPNAQFFMGTSCIHCQQKVKVIP